MFFRDLQNVILEDIISLAAEGVVESRTLDFKRDQIGSNDKAKRDFLKDVAAFANTVGGTLLLGICEKNGAASTTPGIDLDDPDKEILRLTDIIRSGIEPKVPRVDIRWIRREGKNGFLAINVPRSVIAPHCITFQHHGKFYSRANNANYPMDVVEIRNAFLAGNSLPKLMREYRDERLALIASTESPVELEKGVKVTVHIFPEVSFLDKIQVSPSDQNSLIPPIGHRRSVDSRYTIDGYLTVAGGYDLESRPHPAYTLVSSNGIIESVVIERNEKNLSYTQITLSTIL
ncbi:AlbA family DNA-binding domain-containing protein [Alterisphingorhabdus coralli]|uniref:ATP-binding protein n=1 Tax=Alterisphingorhabdus coralli TaxID=3071408 RepID=A0AA97F570_9SPHN|nr:ATP-binding protein [Parasphingorhabdus sp. SCSIO 66989]WOE74426.1 ATP-binding protein [Parasphingorhabdus sp. SCSIO 66989]